MNFAFGQCEQVKFFATFVSDHLQSFVAARSSLLLLFYPPFYSIHHGKYWAFFHSTEKLLSQHDNAFVHVLSKTTAEQQKGQILQKLKGHPFNTSLGFGTKNKYNALQTQKLEEKGSKSLWELFGPLSEFCLFLLRSCTPSLRQEENSEDCCLINNQMWNATRQEILKRELFSIWLFPKGEFCFSSNHHDNLHSRP